MSHAAHRRSSGRATGRWGAPFALLAVAAALLVSAGPTLAVPGGPAQPGPAAQAPQAGGPAQPGAAGQPADEPEPQVWTGVPGTNLAHDSYGYPWPAAPDCDESDVGAGGCVNDGLGFFQGQCTSWVAYRLGQRNGLAFSNWFGGRHWGNASEWAKVAKQLGHKPNKVPAVGAIGWYARGHVSYVEEVNSDGSIVVSEMNTDGHNGFHLVTVRPGDYSWPDRFLHLADVVPVDYTAPDRPSPVTATAAADHVAVRWRAPADDLGVTGYRVFRNGVQVAQPVQPSYVDRQASPGQAYTYAVVAHDAAGNVSAQATTVVDTTPEAPERLQGRFLPDSSTVVAAGDSTAVCGRLGTVRDQRIGCRLRTLDGWRTVRTGRHVPWGLPLTRAFLPDGEGRIWFCRVLPGEQAANACLPLDLATLSWGYDRVDVRTDQPAYATWVPAGTGPVRCGTTGDRATCAALVEKGWRTRTTDLATRPGDPLSRAFVSTDRGVGFCRNVVGRATCTVLDLGRLAWGRDAVSGHRLPHGRWVSRHEGPTLCLDEPAGCRLVTRTKD
ncbi:MAG TPA: CHAP domain-containing protein [Nocardioides sp.]|nr:CHAP domain-containing protein [Nocardioides sp.]